MAWDWRSGQGSGHIIGCIIQIRPKCMVTNDPQISVAYSLYLPLILYSHCGLTVHLLSSGFQVDGAALIWNITGLQKEGKEKVEDHLIAFKVLCESGCATSIWPNIMSSSRVGCKICPEKGAADVKTNNRTCSIGYGEDITFYTKGYRKPEGCI